jgi:hypothetical protein
MKKLRSSTEEMHSLQVCQMVYFQTEYPNLGKLWGALEWKMLVLFMAIWNILLPCGMF